MAFKFPLKSKDEFVQKLNVRKEGIKHAFYQDIYRLPDMKLCIRAKSGKCLFSERCIKMIAPQLDEKLAPFFQIEK